MHQVFYGVILAGVLAGCTSPMPAAGPDTHNRVVDIVNTTAMPMQFYARNAENHRAGQARFGAGAVEANYYRVINFDDETGACRFDLYAEFADGRSVEARRFDTCDEVSWVVTEEMLE